MVSKADTYSFSALLQLANLKKAELNVFIRMQSVRQNLDIRRRVQMSLAQYRKKIPFDIQMKLIAITLEIEKYCRSFLMAEFRKQVKQKYPLANESKIKALAKAKTELFMAKYAY